MHRPRLPAQIVLLLVGLGAIPCHGQSFVFDYEAGAQAIPDDSLSGLSDVHDIGSHFGIASVSIQLHLSGAASENGDIYAYLQHGSTVAILLNRVGKDTEHPGGYSDAGFNVTFDDHAANGDIHYYRETIFGNANQALGGPLTDTTASGSWAPDGRATLPTIVTRDDPRTRTLSGFDGMDAFGEWTLFVADAASGHAMVLDGWTLNLTEVPELANSTLGAGLVLVSWAVLWKTRRLNRD